MRSWHRAILSALVLAAFCGSAWATCIEGESLTEQMACCKAGHERCPMHDSASDCCTKTGPQLELQATLVNSAPAPTPIFSALTWISLPAAQPLTDVHRVTARDSSPPLARVHPPSYILFSTLLI
jgi:hypothetical protein